MRQPRELLQEHGGVLGRACNNLGLTLEKTGDLPAAARTLV